MDKKPLDENSTVKKVLNQLVEAGVIVMLDRDHAAVSKFAQENNLDKVNKGDYLTRVLRAGFKVVRPDNYFTDDND